jgi:hypothetical protein
VGHPVGDIGAVEDDAALIRSDDATDDVERRGLAGAVGPDQAGYRPFRNCERATVDRLEAPVGLADPADFQKVG